jgi:hypothetical protein
MNKQFFIILITSIFLSGCAEIEEVPVVTTYKPIDYIEYMKAGTGEITGQAFMRQKGGVVVTCAGQVVMLVPNEGIFVEIDKIYESGKKPIKPKVDLNSDAVKKTKCDAQGNFMFNHVPAGQWIIQTEVRWEAGNFPQGGYLSEKIYLYAGEKVNRILSK